MDRKLKALVWLLSGVVVVLAIILTVVLTSDRETTQTATTQPAETEKAEQTEQTEQTERKLTVDEVLQAFKDAGLEAENPREMTKEDYGLAPMKAQEAKRFFIPSLGEDAGGRIFSFDNKADLKQTKEFYDSAGKESAILFSWTIEKGNILVQINGDLPKEKYEKYKKALDELAAKKGL